MRFFCQYPLCIQQNSTVRAVRPTAAPTIIPTIAPLPSPPSELLFGGEVDVGETCSFAAMVEEGVALLMIEDMVVDMEATELVVEFDVEESMSIWIRVENSTRRATDC